MTKQDIETEFHYGLLVKERRKTRQLSQAQLSKLSNLPVKKIAEIEATGMASNRDKEKIDMALHRYSYIAVVHASTEAIQEQTDIIEAMQHTLLTKIKNRIGIDTYSQVEALLTDIIIETSYYGLLISRGGYEERILAKVRARRTNNGI